MRKCCRECDRSVRIRHGREKELVDESTMRVDEEW